MSFILAKVRKLLLFFVVGFLGVQPVMALNNADYLKYSQNDIYFYTPGKCVNASDVRGNSNGGDVFLIGDSISVNSQSQIKKELPNIIIDALSGTYFSHNDNTFGLGGTERISAMDDQDILVFAMGTNGGINYTYKDDTEKLFAALNGRNTKVILMTIYYSGSYSYSQMEESNEVVRQLAEQYSNISIMDWAAVAGSNPEKYISSDHVHPTDEGKTKFAETVRDAVNKISSVGSQTIDGTGDYSSIMTAKNANESVFNVSRDSEWWAGWGDGNVEQMTRVLDHYGDLAYQTGKAVGVPWVGIIVQMRYEDSASVCGANNFWGNGCSGSHTGVGGASIQGENLGEGFVQYAKTITNGYHDKALGISDPVEFLDALAPTWIGTGNLYNMKKSVESMLDFIETPEGQAIVSQFGNYTGTSTVTGASRQICNSGPNYTNGNGVTTFAINGHTYAFPIADATKANYLANTSELKAQYSNYAGVSVQSTPSTWYHHNEKYGGGNQLSSADMGIAYKMTGEADRNAQYYISKYGSPGLYADNTDYPYYASSGAKVVATIGGTLYWANESRNGYSFCSDAYIIGDDGHTWNYIHILRDDDLYSRGSRRVELGEVISEVGTPECADRTQSHLHFMIDGAESGIDIATYLNPLYDALPANATELAQREAAANDIQEGGLTYEQAKEFMMNYGANKDGSSEDAAGAHSWRLCGGGGSNCVTFSSFFLNKFTSTSGSDLPDGKDVVSTLRARGAETGDSPRVWAVFSWNGGEYGHTGVILGYRDGKWIVGHASCTRGNNGKRGAGDGTKSGGGSGVVEMNADILTAIWGNSASNIQYAYFDNEIDIAAINNYLANGV